MGLIGLSDVFVVMDVSQVDAGRMRVGCCFVMLVVLGQKNGLTVFVVFL